ncbi:hypothetical protein [Williamsia sp.]|uniref:hypothetical protein n=1 Tax=Williamsia sp. TaxID=1872085 RepID=UPI002F94EFFE
MNEESRDAFVLVGEGAFQVYDSTNSLLFSQTLQEMFSLPNVYVLGGDWRGYQYLVSSADELNDPQSVVQVFDPSSMSLDPLVDLGSFQAAILSGDIVAAVDGPAFVDWCNKNQLDGIPEGHCVSPVRYAFLSGYDPRLDVKPISTIVYINLAAKLRVKMQDMGIEPGGPPPDDFFEGV